MTVTVTDVEFASPLPGLSPYTAFTLDAIPGAEGLYALRSVEAAVRLFLLDPVAVGGLGYEPPLTAGILAEVGADDVSEVRVLVVANPGDDGVRVNLRAPVIVHRESGRANQVILEDQTYPIRALIGG